MNPLFPFNTYIPDCEPHVFNNRVYIYGSHDLGKTYCEGSYEVFSADINDLTNWTSIGISYNKEEDLLIPKIRKDMYAPDAVKGNDGRYYLYYCLSNKAASHGYSTPIRVAVSDNPDGPYKFYGYVKDKNGNPYCEFLNFDPAVINDDGTIRLYYGAWFPFFQYRGLKTILGIFSSFYFQRKLSEVLKRKADFMGGIEVELEDDMLTIKGPGKHVTPIYPKGTSFEKHPFFEASSIRKFNNTYYFIYSSIYGHELCYATSKYPDKEFVFKGVLISNGDIGLDGIKPKDRRNYTGNNHGSILNIGESYYIFYHKMTHRDWYHRVGCAERLKMNPDGTFEQAEMTSMGLSDLLKDKGTYNTSICSTLTDHHMPHINPFLRKTMPAIMDDGKEYYIQRIKNKTIIGFKYFNFTGEDRTISVKVRGKAKGYFIIKDGYDGKEIARIDINPSKDWTDLKSNNFSIQGSTSLFFEFKGRGKLDFKSITIE